MSVTPGIVRTSILVVALYIAPAELSDVYRCPAGLTGSMYTHSGQCYRYVDSKVTWNVASADCSSSNGGHLVVILDQATQTFISSIPFPDDAYQVWIGFTDRNQEQVWAWVTDGAWSYDFWAHSFPELCFGGNSVCPEDCAYLRTSDGRWREDHCNNAQVKYQYICQYSMGPTTTSTTTTPSPTTGGVGPLTEEAGALSKGGLVGLVLALVLVLLLILVTLLVIVRKRNRRKRYEADDIAVRFQNHTYDTNRPPNSYVLGGQFRANNGVCSPDDATANIYENPGPKPCNGGQNEYEKPVNRDRSDHGLQDSHYALVKDYDMIDPADKHLCPSDFGFKQSECLSNGSAGMHSCNASSEMADPSYASQPPQTDMSEEVSSNRSNEQLLQCFEEYNKAPSAYDNNLYIKDKNCYK